MRAATGAELDRWARELDRARRTGRTLDRLFSDRGLTSLADAYAVQRRLTQLRLERRASVVGWKLGYTSVAMREQMGISEPNHGPLLDTMQLRDAMLPSRGLQPRVEPEIALRLQRAVPPGARADTVLACCSAAYACLEVVDSVWTDYRFTLLDNTADGSSAGWFRLGDELPLDGLDTLDVALLLGDQVVDRASGAAAGGHPALGVGWLAGQLRDDPRGLLPGDVVITGGLTAAIPLALGATVTARFGHRRHAVAVSRGRHTVSGQNRQWPLAEVAELADRTIRPRPPHEGL